MSIKKNLIQQENDISRMSIQTLANYLNNPTGQYNPYLVAGQLKNRELEAERLVVEAPQETVVDELLAEAMPMGGMPRGGMPQPRPEEMVSESITETGISNLPAPNIGQNYAGGGIVGYDNGGEVGMWDELKSDIKTDWQQYKIDSAREKLERKERDADQWKRASEYYNIHGKMPYDEHLSEEEKAIRNEEMMDLGMGVGILGVGGKARQVAKPIKKYGKKYIKKAKDWWKKRKVEPKVTKPKLTKKETADFLKKSKNAATKERRMQLKRDALKGTPGGVDRAIGRGLAKTADLATSGIAHTVAGGIRNPATAIGLGLGGIWAKSKWDESQKAAEAKKLADDAAEAERKATIAADKAARRAQYDRQRELEIVARDKRREKEMYLALALGGAKTMAGQSPYALANIGEGMGSGVAALAAYDQNEMERMAASQAATLKAQQDMAIALAEYTSNYYKQINDLGPEASAELAALDKERDNYTTPDYIAKKESIYRKYVGISPKDYEETISGQTFYAAE